MEGRSSGSSQLLQFYSNLLALPRKYNFVLTLFFTHERKCGRQKPKFNTLDQHFKRPKCNFNLIESTKVK